MARQLRIEYEGAFYHVTSRGNQRDQIFWDDNDREEFKKIIKRTKERYAYLLHSYVLMDNHYHLLIETPHANIKQVMQNVNTSYTVYVNRRHRRAGHLFQGRYKAFIVDKESYLIGLGRYIHLNPVRAGIVERPEDYRWSSYGDYMYGGSKQLITDTGDTLHAFSKSRATAAKRYHEFVKAGIKEESPLREVVGSILGDEGFRELVKKHLKGIPDKAEIPDIKRIEPKYKVEDIIRMVGKNYGIGVGELLRRKKATESQRKMAIYLGKTLSGSTNREVGRVFGITAQAVTNAVRDIENRMEEDSQFTKEIAKIKKSAERVKCIM